MRWLCLAFLLAFGGAVVLLAVENQQDVSLTFFGRAFTTSVALLAGGSYLLGMFSGWTIVGMLRRSLRRVTDYPVEQRGAAPAR